ncbi:MULTISPECIES: rhomboid family intramembrane serine protease [Inquilinus]|uniref:Membrane associated rhomboid family serine protease n=1 Tax=Inquilinus ginsengisoli TaxID=363840 RepID=A0ABU1JVQ0_9PROT|nr:rhomboid family intramembrane serine protease [Inquilinus ginsengisoli]MDR6292388.1 membrane associated rhomboid family serine protease [Inquilinus ginsengisoli]
MSRQPIFNVPPITMWLSVVLVAVFAAIHLLPETLWGPIINRMVVVPVYFEELDRWTALDALTVISSLVFYAFIHVEPIHLVANLGFFLAFGSVCERQFGKRRYIVLLLATTVAAALVQVAASWGQEIQLYGASGAVSGCIGAFCRLMLATHDPARRRLAMNLIGFTVIANVLFALLGGGLMGLDAQIAWQAHIGGFLAGILLGTPKRA